MKIPVSVRIGITLLAPYAVGETIEERFKNIVKPEHLSEGCWMTSTDDEQFRSAVGALMLSYGEGTPEFERIQAEMKFINQFSAFINAAKVGLSVSPLEIDENFQAIGLLKLWKERLYD